MPKITDERRAERRMQIIDAAWACFERKGPHATTMDDIITTSGLSAGAVYSYFKSKDDLIVAAHSVALAGFGVEITKLFDARPLPSPADLTYHVLTVVSEYAARRGLDARRNTVFVWGEALRNPRLLEALQTFYAGFLTQLREAAKIWRRDGSIAADVDPTDVAKTLLSLVLGFVTHSVLIGDVTPDAIRRAVLGLHATEAADRRGPPAATGAAVRKARRSKSPALA